MRRKIIAAIIAVTALLGLGATAAASAGQPGRRSPAEYSPLGLGSVIGREVHAGAQSLGVGFLVSYPGDRGRPYARKAGASTCPLPTYHSVMRAVVFDMDGLMFNTEDIYTLVGRELLRRCGAVFSDELKKDMMGVPPQQSFEMMIARHRLAESCAELAAESNARSLSLVAEHIRPLPGLFDLLGRLEKAGTPKAIATSSARPLLDACLAPFDLHARFQFFLTAEDVVVGKPNPEVYLLAARRLGVPPAEMIVLEDSQNGCKAASSAGAFTVAVPGAHSRDHDFSTACAVISSLADPRLHDVLGI